MENPTTLVSPIRAIETHYNGFRFRSRLEARWAVLFDALSISYSYESEGFHLPSGTWYLPDFLLPKVNLWAEVKPIEFTPAEKDKCKQLVDGTGTPCLLLVGQPDFKTYMAVHSADMEDMIDLPNTRYECDYLLDIDYHGRKHYNRGRLFGDTGGSFLERSDFSLEYQKAVHLSRAARFYGEAA